MTLSYGRDEARAWGRDRLQGVCNVVIPSYTADLSDINEGGIRHDVRLQIHNNFSGFLAVSETSITPEEYLRFVSICSDEADGRQLVIHHAGFNSLEENIAVAKGASKAGAELALLAYPPNFWPTSEEDIYEYTRAFCDGVDMAVILFPVPLWGFERIHPAGISLRLLRRLVEKCPTIAAIKAEGGYPSLGGFIEVWNDLHDEVVVTMPLETHAIPLATILPLQVSATSNTEYFGDVVPRAFDLARSGKHEEAMDLYWQMDPARRANATIGGVGGFNSVHRMAWKYQAWLNGYNGGPLRMPTARLVYSQMKTLRSGLLSSGLPCTDDPDELYWMGRNPA